MDSIMTNAPTLIASEAAGLFPVMIGNVPKAMVMQSFSMGVRTRRTDGLKQLQVDPQRAEERLILRAFQFHQQACIQSLCEASVPTQSILSLFR